MLTLQGEVLCRAVSYVYHAPWAALNKQLLTKKNVTTLVLEGLRPSKGGRSAPTNERLRRSTPI